MLKFIPLARSRISGYTSAVGCAPSSDGSQVITVNYEPPNFAPGKYDQRIDQASRLYCKRKSPQTYLANIDSLLAAR